MEIVFWLNKVQLHQTSIHIALNMKITYVLNAQQAFIWANQESVCKLIHYVKHQIQQVIVSNATKAMFQAEKLVWSQYKFRSHSVQ